MQRTFPMVMIGYLFLLMCNGVLIAIGCSLIVAMMMAYNGCLALTTGILSHNDCINHNYYLTLNQCLGTIQALLLVPNHLGPSFYHLGARWTIHSSLSSHPND